MRESTPFLRVIREAVRLDSKPHERTARLVYADWLSEREKTLEGDFQRWLANKPYIVTPMKILRDNSYTYFWAFSNFRLYVGTEIFEEVLRKEILRASITEFPIAPFSAKRDGGVRPVFRCLVEQKPYLLVGFPNKSEAFTRLFVVFKGNIP